MDEPAGPSFGAEDEAACHVSLLLLLKSLVLLGGLCRRLRLAQQGRREKSETEHFTPGVAVVLPWRNATRLGHFEKKTSGQ